MTRLFFKIAVLVSFTLFTVSASQPTEAEKHDEHRLYDFEERFEVVWKEIVEFFETNDIKVRTTEEDRASYLFGDTDKVKIFAHSSEDKPNQTTVLITTTGAEELREELMEHLKHEHTWTDVNAVIKNCYKEVTGKEAKNINRITSDTDSKLEECVDEEIELSDFRIKLQYSGSKTGLIPTIHSVVSVND